MHQALNSPAQRLHSAVKEREKATPKESMTLEVQVNISKAAKFTIACQLLCVLPPLSSSSLMPSHWRRFERRALLYGSLFSHCVKTLEASVKADERLGMREN